jgi:hypothetical protein
MRRWSWRRRAAWPRKWRWMTVAAADSTRRRRGVLLLSIRVATRGRALRRLARAPRLRGRGRRLEAALALVLLPGRHREEVADDAHELRLGQLAHARLRDVRQEVDLRAALLHRAERVRLRPGEVHAAARAGRGGAREDARRHRRGGKATATSDERLCDTRRHRTARRCFPRGGNARRRHGRGRRGFVAPAAARAHGAAQSAAG